MSAEHKRLLTLVKRLPEDYTPFGKTDPDALDQYVDCSCGCKYALLLEGELGADWCVCTNPESHRCGLLTFEHQGCTKLTPTDKELNND